MGKEVPRGRHAAQGLTTVEQAHRVPKVLLRDAPREQLRRARRAVVFGRPVSQQDRPIAVAWATKYNSRIIGVGGGGSGGGAAGCALARETWLFVLWAVVFVFFLACLITAFGIRDRVRRWLRTAPPKALEDAY